MNNQTLAHAWEIFSRYDENAKYHQNNFNKIQLSILLIGVAVSVLALGETQFQDRLKGTMADSAVKLVVLILPITISVLVAAANYFKSGNKWVLLRASAEDIKSEIYRYRTKVGQYNNQAAGQSSPESKLANKVETISNHLMQTEVSLSSLKKYEGTIPPPIYGTQANDDGFSYINPDQYLEIRIGDQLNYYQNMTRQMDTKLKIFQWIIYISGGVGTFLAAIGVQLWVALTTTSVAVFTTYLAYRQVENTLMKYNQTTTGLESVKAWWVALSSSEKLLQENVDKLVDTSETMLQTELLSWVQNMQNALIKLRQQQEPKK